MTAEWREPPRRSPYLSGQRERGRSLLGVFPAQYPRELLWALDLRAGRRRDTTATEFYRTRRGVEHLYPEDLIPMLEGFLRRAGGGTGRAANPRWCSAACCPPQPGCSHCWTTCSPAAAG